MAFPDEKFDSAEGFASGYFRTLRAALESVNGADIARAAELLRTTVRNDGLIFSCGNGGSAAIANHLVCDCGKGMRVDNDMLPRVFSLSNSVEMITAIGNDIDFAEIFAHQLRSAARPGDLLITISSSGDSEDIIRAIDWARSSGVRVIALSGFTGGRSRARADVALHVAAHNYGVVEDAHQSLIHILAQFLRQSEMPSEIVPQRKF
jgi:phosphoheptose isomerase